MTAISTTGTCSASLWYSACWRGFGRGQLRARKTWIPHKTGWRSVLRVPEITQGLVAALRANYRRGNGFELTAVHHYARHRRLRADYARLGGMERSYAADNARELERLRALVSKLSDQDLGSMVNEYWTVAGVLGHMAFWDGRALFLAGKLQRGEAFTPSDTEPEDVDWINDSTRPLIHAIPPGQAAKVALRIAEETDELVASLSPELVAKIDANSPLNPVRADHRGEHLDEIEAALAGRDATRRPT